MYEPDAWRKHIPYNDTHDSQSTRGLSPCEHFIQNEMYLDKHKDIKRELDMKYEHIKRLKENIYSRQRFIDNLSSKK